MPGQAFMCLAHASLSPHLRLNGLTGDRTSETQRAHRVDCSDFQALFKIDMEPEKDRGVFSFCCCCFLNGILFFCACVAFPLLLTASVFFLLVCACYTVPCFSLLLCEPFFFLAFAAFCAFFLAWFVFPAVSPGWLYFVPSSRRLWRSESL